MRIFSYITISTFLFQVMLLSADAIPECSSPECALTTPSVTELPSTSLSDPVVDLKEPMAKLTETSPGEVIKAPEWSFGISNSQYFLSLRRNQGRSLGSKISYTTIESLSFPFHYENIWPFLDLRAHCFDEMGKYAANIGVGFRVAPKFTNQIFGVNAYYDCRNASHSHFNQLGIGVEMLGECWNFRLNGYLPVGQKSFLKSCCFFNEYIGDFFFLRENFIDGLKGVNFEIESWVGEICCAEIYLAIGAYYYQGKGCRRSIYGSEYRVSTDFCDNFTFSIFATHDCVFNTRIQAQLSFTLPLSCQCEEDARLFQRIYRQEIVVLQKRKRFQWNF